MATGQAHPRGIDGISFAPTLRGEKQPPRPFLYRESPGYGGQQCVRVGDWKAIQTKLNPNKSAANVTTTVMELYDLASDPGETNNVAGQQPDLVASLGAIMKQQHVKSDLFPIRTLDGNATSTGQ
ncbi:MAG: hypothetical protein V9H26_16725 [Verrucomicrobiota bacterium]